MKRFFRPKEDAPPLAAQPLPRILMADPYGGANTDVLRKLASMLPQAKHLDAPQYFEKFMLNGFDILTTVRPGGRVETPPLPQGQTGQGSMFVVDAKWKREPTYSWRLTTYNIRHVLKSNTLERSPIPILIYCINHDMPGALSPNEVGDLIGIQAFQKTSPCKVVGCSIDTGEGLLEGLHWLNENMRGHHLPLPTWNISQTKETEDDTVATEPTVLTQALDYEPHLENPTLRRFEIIQKHTQCPFAKAAKLWGGKDIPAGTPLEEQAAANLPALTEFCRRVQEGEALDGFCLDLDDEEARQGGPAGLGESVRQFLTKLSDEDPAEAQAMRTPLVSSRGWKFQFAGIEFFVTTFAPFYPRSSSRYAFGSERVFVLLQPLSSFSRHKLPPDTTASETNWTQPKTIRDHTRVAFHKAGRPYHIPETISYPPAEHIVKPLHDDNSSVIRWWLPRMG
jgi:hypothetical protein